MAKTTIIGKVAVKVYPDTDNFHRDLQRQLNREEKRAEFEVPVEVDTEKAMVELRAAMREMHRLANDETLKAKIKVDTKQARGELDRFAQDTGKYLQPKQFETLQTQKIFDPSNVKQFKDRIREINRVMNAEQKLAAQRDRAMKDQRDNLVRQMKLEKSITDQNEKAQKDEAARIKKSIQDASKAAADQVKLEKSIREQNAKALKEAKEATAASEKLRRDMAKAKFDDDFAKMAKKNKSLLDEIDDSVNELDRHMQEIDQHNRVQFELKLDGMKPAERRIHKLQIQLEALSKQQLRPELTEEQRLLIMHKVRELKDKIEDELDNIKAEVEPNMGWLMMKRVALRLAVLTRDRIVSIIPKVNHAALATATAALTALTALGGGRLYKNVITDLFDAFENLDKHIPKLALVSNGLAGIAAWALSASSNLFSLSSSLAQIGPAALALPGIFGAMALGLATTYMGFRDFNKVIPNVATEWKKLQDVVSANFWKEARQPFVDMTEVIMPQMREGFAIAGKEIGSFWGSFATDLADSLTKGGKLREMFKDLGDSTAIVKTSTKEMSDIIVRLGEKGTGLLPRMATWFVDITERFDTFLAKADKSGQLDQWIETGIVNLRMLGSVVYETGSILGGLGQAAQKAGGSTLASLAKTLGDIADKVHSPEFQKDLVGVLKAAGTAMDNISKYAGPGMDKFFDSFAKTLQKVLPMAGETIGKALGGIADALAQPDFQDGLINLFKGIQAGVSGLLPYLPSLGDALGEVLGLIGKMAETFLPTVGLILGTLSHVFTILAPSINDVVELLGGTFTDLIRELAPVAVQLAIALAPVLESLGTSFAESLKIATPYIAAIAKELGEGLLQALEKIAPILPDIVRNLFPQLLTVVKEIVPQIPLLVGGFLDLVDILVNTNLVADLGTLAGALLRLVADDVLPVLVENLPKLADSMSMFAGALEKTVTVVDGFDIMGDLFDVVMNWNPASLMEAMGKIGADIMYSLVKGFGGGETIEKFLLWLTASIPLWKGPPSTDATLLTPAGRSIMNSLIQGFKDVDVQGALRSLTWHIPDAFNFPPGFLKGAAEGLINGFVGGLWGSFHLVSEALGWLTKQLPEWKGPPSRDKTLLTGAGQSIMQSLVDGLKDGFRDVQSYLATATDEIAGTEFALGGVSAGDVSTSAAKAVASSLETEAVDGSTGSAGDTYNFYTPVGTAKEQVTDAMFELRNMRRGGK